MDVVFGFVGDKFAVVVTDTVSVQQIIVQKDDMEKTLDLDSHKLMAMSGPKGDCVYFGEYIQANMKLYELKNGSKLSTHAAANFTRNNLAESLRKGPYQVNILLAGYDADADECSLYFMDYMASMQKVNSGKDRKREKALGEGRLGMWGSRSRVQQKKKKKNTTTNGGKPSCDRCLRTRTLCASVRGSIDEVRAG